MAVIIEHIVGPVVVAFCGYMTYLLKDNKKTSKANAQGTMLLLRRQIILAHHKFVVLGDPMTAFDFEDLEEIHNAYKDLGGNGLTDKMWDEISELKLHKAEKGGTVE